MPCTHKFFGHSTHLSGNKGLLPDWPADTLIIGTFNPENLWAPHNDAGYFYGRSRNYFWRILPLLSNSTPINRQDVQSQITFLKKNRIACTDLLISINDAEINQPEHIAYIKNFEDDAIGKFKNLTWNTVHIKDYIVTHNIQAVYFTKLGGNGIFEEQIRDIEEFCKTNNKHSNRLFTPSGQGLRDGKPRINKLIHKWYHENGGKRFPFLSSDFNPGNFPWQ